MANIILNKQPEDVRRANIEAALFGFLTATGSILTALGAIKKGDNEQFDMCIKEASWGYGRAMRALYGRDFVDKQEKAARRKPSTS